MAVPAGMLPCFSVLYSSCDHWVLTDYAAQVIEPGAKGAPPIVLAGDDTVDRRQLAAVLARPAGATRKI